MIGLHFETTQTSTICWFYCIIRNQITPAISFDAGDSVLLTQDPDAPLCKSPLLGSLFYTDIVHAMIVEKTASTLLIT